MEPSYPPISEVFLLEFSYRANPHVFISGKGIPAKAADEKRQRSQSVDSILDLRVRRLAIGRNTYIQHGRTE
jgi:hypothetical protein